jgi:hypothetical protein
MGTVPPNTAREVLYKTEKEVPRIFTGKSSAKVAGKILIKREEIKAKAR